MLPLRGTLTLYDRLDGDMVLIASSEWFFCRATSGYYEVDPGLAVWCLRQLSGYELESARTFVAEAHLHYVDAGWMRPVGLHDHRPIDIIIEAIHDHRVLVVKRGAAAVPAKSATAELRGLVAQLPQRGTLVFQGRQYELVVADDLARLANRDRYEAVSQSAARDVLDGLAKESPAFAQVLGQAGEKIGKDWRPPLSDPEGLVLMRVIPVRPSVGKDTGPAIAPSQMKALLDAGKREKGPLWVRVDMAPKLAKKLGAKFVLTSSDSSISITKTVKDDMEPGNDTVNLLFEDLWKDLSYSLQVEAVAGSIESLFEGVPYGNLASQAGSGDDSGAATGEGDSDEVEPVKFTSLVALFGYGGGGGETAEDSDE